MARQFRPHRIEWYADLGRSVARQAVDRTYKAHRPARPSAFSQEFRLLHRVLPDLVPVYRCHDREVDEAIAGRVQWAVGRGTHHLVIVSTDRDFYELLQDEPTRVIRLYDPYRRMIRTATWFQTTYGVQPWEWPGVRALCGDASDGVVGYAGVGETRAPAWYRQRVRPYLVPGPRPWHRVPPLPDLPDRGRVFRRNVRLLSLAESVWAQREAILPVWRHDRGRLRRHLRGLGLRSLLPAEPWLALFPRPTGEGKGGKGGIGKGSTLTG